MTMTIGGLLQHGLFSTVSLARSLQHDLLQHRLLQHFFSTDFLREVFFREVFFCEVFFGKVFFPGFSARCYVGNFVREGLW